MSHIIHVHYLCITLQVISALVLPEYAFAVGTRESTEYVMST